MRILFLASGEFALPTLNWLARSDHQIASVITQPARKAGRGRKVTPTPVGVLAEKLNLSVIEAENVNDPAIIGQVRSLKAHLGLAIAFGQKLGPEFLSTAPAGCLNLHASLLPKYRGAAPINWAIIGGEEKTGVTVFRIVERMDAGPILTDRWTYIKPDETAGELHDRLAAIGVDAVQSAVELFAGDEVPQGTPQDESFATRAPKLKKKDGGVDFDQLVDRLTLHIRGMTPWPGASAIFEAQDGRWEKVILVSARRAQCPDSPVIDPGIIDARRYVAARDAFLEILEIKPAAGRIMTWAEYVNGRHVTEGDQFVMPE